MPSTKLINALGHQPTGHGLKRMYDICCIGHITSDKVVTPRNEVYMPGGTAYYFSCAVSQLHLKYLLATAIAPAELHYVAQLQTMGIETMVQYSKHTVFFENIYGENHDERAQNVLETADAFTIPQFNSVDAQIFHLGPLLAGDISTDLIKTLAVKGKVSLDVQGYLRRVVDHKVYPANWADKQAALQHVSIVKADVAELKTLSGCETIEEGAHLLADWGVNEVVITNGSQGSQIYSEGIFYNIPAYVPAQVVDATGCGDTYMAGYLYQRQKGASIPEAGNFAAAMAGLKTAKPGAFAGTEEEVVVFMDMGKKVA